MCCLPYLQLVATKTVATTKFDSGRYGKDDVTFCDGRRIGCVRFVVSDIDVPRVRVVQKFGIFDDGRTTTRFVPWFIKR